MKNRLPIIVAIVLAIVAVMAMRAYVGRVKQQSQKQLEGKKYVAAKVNIAANTEIDSAMITAREVPDQFVPAQAVRGTKKEAELLVGQRARVPIKMGQVILWSDLVTERHGGFESVVPSGERAFSIKLSGGVKGGLLQPSDHVDILASFALPETKREQTDKNMASWRERSDMVNIVLLQNVTVLAVGETYTGSNPSVTEAEEITVAVTLPEAQLLMFAEKHGDLGAVLRRQDDMQTLKREELPRITFQEIEKLVGDLDTLRTRRTVEILKGGRTEEVSIEDKPAQDGQ